MRDFSGFSTEKLKTVTSKGCYGIDCHADNCPIKSFCHLMTMDEVSFVMKEELNRREKDMNEMPELKAGMIVDYEGHGLLLCLPDGDGYIRFYEPNLYGAEVDRGNITKIYNHTGNRHYKAMFEEPRGSDLILIWSRKSDNDIKIEEIQNKMNELSKELEELKG